MAYENYQASAMAKVISNRGVYQTISNSGSLSWRIAKAAKRRRVSSGKRSGESSSGNIINMTTARQISNQWRISGCKYVSGAK